MKKYIFYLLTILVFVCCTDNSSYTVPEKNNENNSQKPNNTINTKLFDIVNLDYPGLEKAKKYYTDGLHYDAAKEILEYYRSRTDVVNPNISLVNVTVTEGDKQKANYALDDYRFFVNNYYEDAATAKPYSLRKGGDIDWDFKPAGADDEYQKQLHRHQWFVPQAKIYRTSKDETHIKSWISVYENWWINNPKPESGTNNTTWWQLQVAARVTDQTQLFDYYKSSINFTPEWFAEFACRFAEQADFLVQYPYPSGGNILVAQANALAFAGVLFPEFKNAEEWMSTGYSTLNNEVKKQFLNDGMHSELDLSYHIGAIADFYETMKLAEANPTITASVPTDFTASLHKATEVVTHFTYPGYFNAKQVGHLVPGFNDTRQESWKKSVLARNFGRYAEMFPSDKELQYMASAGKQGSAPSVEPKAFTEAGYYMLRNGWTPSSTMMVLSNNYSKAAINIWTHNQPDNGTFELYHNGRNFFPDSGVFAYYTQGGNNTNRSWYRQTKAHNTMTLGGKSISSTLAKTLKVASEKNCDIIAFENPGYTNLKHRRYVFFVDKKFFVLVDEAIGTATGTVNLNFHLCEGTDSEVVVDKTEFGAHTAFADGNNISVRSFGDLMSVVPFDGKVSYNVQVEASRKSYSVDMAKTTAKAARYITVIYPTTSDASSVQIAASFKDNGFQESGVNTEVVIDGKSYTLKCNL